LPPLAKRLNSPDWYSPRFSFAQKSRYPALSRSRQIPLHEIYRKTGQRVRHQNTVDGEEIDREDIVKGYEVEKGEYVILEPKEIDALKVRRFGARAGVYLQRDKAVTEIGKCANWITPPDRGINNHGFDYEYIRAA